MPDSQVRWFGDDLLKQIQDGAPDALFDGAKLLVDSAASRAPRRSGKLAQSGYVGTEKKSTYHPSKIYNKEVKAPKGGAVAAFAAFYAKQVEFGNKNMSAKPFLRPALDELKEQVGQEIVVKLRRKLK